MTFEEWWALFVERYGKPEYADGKTLLRILAKTAWDAGYWEGMKHPSGRIATQEAKSNKEG